MGAADSGAMIDVPCVAVAVGIGEEFSFEETAGVVNTVP